MWAKHSGELEGALFVRSKIIALNAEVIGEVCRAQRLHFPARVRIQACEQPFPFWAWGANQRGVGILDRVCYIEMEIRRPSQ